MDETKIKAIVSMTRKWGAKEAGREIAETTFEKMKENPDIMILFSTIHYDTYGGFQNLLDGIYEIFPKTVKIVGGTVRGFSNNYGCYARGATSLAISSDEMDIGLGIGRNTKRNPIKAAQKSYEMIQKDLEKSSYKNGFLLNIISGAEIPDLPPIGRKKIIDEGTSTKALIKLLSLSQKTLQMGAARDEEIVEEMVNLGSNYSMMSGATLDDGPGFKNFQFYNNEVLRNALVSIGIKTDYEIYVKTTNMMEKTDIEFEITKMSNDKRLIHEINGKPALYELLRLLQWPKEILNEETWLKTTFYFPIGGKCCKNSQDDMVPHIIGIILGTSLLLTCKLEGTKASILTIDGKRLFDAVDENLSNMPFEPEFGLMSSCITRLETLGNKIFDVREQITQYLHNKPFIEFYVGGESTYSPEFGLEYMNISFNSAIFGQK